ncbi:ribonuclease HI family protein [Patescibacteria group bacterium]|nr:ribonuclease HI family protein [Patescibacteria group bacterium]
MAQTYSMYTDGGSRGNPGPAAAGAVLYGKKGEVLGEVSKALGKMTNNQAEYMALILGLKKAKKLNIKSITSFLDSELIVKQLNGEYKVKNEGMKVLFEEVTDLTQEFKSISFKHIPRTKNKYADALVNKALDKKDRKRKK